ncbi:MAG: hypothetical protein Q9198_010556, partial [Flavoplaca austrocitrina]
PQPSKSLLPNFPTRKFIRKFEFPVQIPVAVARETEEHASDDRITGAARAANISISYNVATGGLGLKKARYRD